MSESENPIYYSTHTWNLALSIASASLDYTEETYDMIGDRSEETIAETFTYLSNTYDEYEQSGDTEIWPFENLFDLVELVEEHVGLDEDGRPLNNLASAISARITESPKYEYRPKADTTESESSAPETKQESPLAEFDEPVRDIAHDLYRCFISHEGLTYRELVSRYDQSFPKRSITLVNVANSKGVNETDRIAHIAEWVDTWFGNDEQVEEVDQFAHEPMGKPVRSH